jgi:CMP-N,N'-diacetyllegionaminic acid synthase
MNNGSLVPYIENYGIGIRSQDLEPVLVINGGFYLISPEELRKNKSFLNSESIPLLINSPQEALDIDTDREWKIAEIECLRF